MKTLWKPRQIDSEKPRNSRLVQGVQAAILDIKTLTGRFDYVGHRTTTSSRLVLEFEHLDTGTIVPMFFNVQIESRRKGKNYRVGEGGQFTFRQRHKFHRFWSEMLGTPPSRPSRAHHGLHRLGKLKLKGEASFKSSERGGYWELIRLERVA